MMNAMEINFGRYSGTQTCPIGTYVNMRTFAYYQQTSDGSLPLAGTWHMLSTNATLTATVIASTINTVLGTAYTAGNFHSYSAGSDALPASQLGQACNDA
ncbi:hypothetical protein [Ktedonobacter racemifer]|uniref:Uncharacterized protein n=1 Tax=Ktedonobacter racemifer DSM 44963 TaxID=485913 RepID=D6TTI7_KTERA|nr:hypothetical protein [Ktedonobacter racemifer]EFH83738.1 hypothetical protein Krac_4733 [Ktedonobacter racemifer DSM 44963]